MVLLLSAACTSPEAPPATPLDTGEWSAAEHVLAVPVWTAEDVELELTAFAGEGLPVVERAREIYLDVAALGDATCPGDTSHFSDETVPLTGCTSEEGGTFAGVASLLQDDEIGGTVRAGFMLFGDFEVADDEGTVLSGGGHAHELVKQTEGDREVTTFLSGSWSAEGDASWLGDGFSGSVSTSGHLANGGFDAELIGSVGLRGRSVYTPGLVFDTATCPEGQARGGIAIRDPSGGWWQLELPEDCSGCGELVWPDGTEHGVICPDLARIGASWKVTAARLVE